MTEALCAPSRGMKNAEADRLIEQMTSLGAPQEAINKVRNHQAPILVDVLAENWEAVQVFKRCKWDRIVGMAATAVTGIPRSEINAVIDGISGTFKKLRNRSFRSKVFDDVLFMEQHALPLLNGD